MRTLKVMFTIVLSLILCVAMLTACQPSNPESPSGSDTATTTAEATTTTTEAVTTTTEVTTTTTEPDNVFTVNEDRLSEIGKTFAELKEQYGDPRRSRYESGGKIHFFQQSNCAYFFGETKDTPFDEAAACITIFYLRANQLFNGLTEDVSATELAEMYGLEHLWSEQMKFYNHDYMSRFHYGDYDILIHANEDQQIGPDSVIENIQLRKE